MTMALARLRTFGCFAGRGRAGGLSAGLRTLVVVVTLMAMALVTRLAVLVTATGTPDLDELGLGGRGCSLRRGSIGRCGRFRCGGLGRSCFESSFCGRSGFFDRRRDAGSIFRRDRRLRRSFERRLLVRGLVVLLQSGTGGGLAAIGGGAAATEGILAGRQATTMFTRASWICGSLADWRHVCCATR